jgi:hypothetical protein
MNGKALEPAYEAARSWALQPISRPPPAWAHIVRSGLAIWMRERPSEGSLVSPDIALIKRLDGSGLLTIVAAMIAEVCS